MMDENDKHRIKRLGKKVKMNDNAPHECRNHN